MLKCYIRYNPRLPRTHYCVHNRNTVYIHVGLNSPIHRSLSCTVYIWHQWRSFCMSTPPSRYTVCYWGQFLQENTGKAWKRSTSKLKLTLCRRGGTVAKEASKRCKMFVFNCVVNLPTTCLWKSKVVCLAFITFNTCHSRFTGALACWIAL